MPTTWATSSAVSRTPDERGQGQHDRVLHGGWRSSGSGLSGTGPTVVSVSSLAATTSGGDVT
jgi:hypothetical protein